MDLKHSIQRDWKYCQSRPPKSGMPDGTTTIYPDLTTRGSTSVGSELVLLANFEDADGAANRVEFYLNGDLGYIDREKPYYFKFKPFSDASVRIRIKSGKFSQLELIMIKTGVPHGIRWKSQTQVFYSKATVKVPTNNSEYAHEQSIKIRIDVTGSI